MLKPRSDRRIQSPELAHYIGYAEYPYMELALQARENNNPVGYQGLLAAAETAGIEEASLYIGTLNNQLARYTLSAIQRSGATVEPSDHVPTTYEKNLLAVRISPKDLFEYVEKLNSQKPGAHDTRSVSRLWSSLGKLIRDLNGQSLYDTQPRIVPMVTVEMDANVETCSGYAICHDISLESLVMLINKFDEIMQKNPSLRVSDILGTGFGQAQIKLLRDFIRNKLIYDYPDDEPYSESGAKL